MSPFAPTRWSLVARAAGSGEDARGALEDLCAAYWYPLYAFARRSGRTIEDAQDLVQGFFARFLEGSWAAQADPGRGRFRTFLLAAFRHHAANVRAAERAVRRGGGRRPLSLDLGDGEARYRLEPVTTATPERLYERRWALTVLDRALDRLDRMHRGGPPDRWTRYQALRPCLEAEHPPYRDVARVLGATETAVKVAVHRLRGRLREALRAEVGDTVTDAGGLDDEIRELRAVLAGGG